MIIVYDYRLWLSFMIIVYDNNLGHEGLRHMNWGHEGRAYTMWAFLSIWKEIYASENTEQICFSQKNDCHMVFYPRDPLFCYTHFIDHIYLRTSPLFLFKSVVQKTKSVK
jgi:hypothetical protein